MSAFRAAAVLMFLLGACGGSDKPASEPSTTSPGARHRHPVPCATDGLYSLPPYEQSAVSAEPAASSAVAAFEAGHAAYDSGDATTATAKFMEAARALGKLPKGTELADWALLARELCYHNALWSASAAGGVSETRAALEKTAAEDAPVSNEIKALLADPPADCAP
jgi:hypothetical protein